MTVLGMTATLELVETMMTLISQHLLLAVFALGVVEMMLLSPILTEMDVTGTTVIQIHVVHMTTLDSLHQKTAVSAQEALKKKTTLKTMMKVAKMT